MGGGVELARHALRKIAVFSFVLALLNKAVGYIGGQSGNIKGLRRPAPGIYKVKGLAVRLEGKIRVIFAVLGVATVLAGGKNHKIFPRLQIYRGQIPLAGLGHIVRKAPARQVFALAGCIIKHYVIGVVAVPVGHGGGVAAHYLAYNKGSIRLTVGFAEVAACKHAAQQQYNGHYNASGNIRFFHNISPCVFPNSDSCRILSNTARMRRYALPLPGEFYSSGQTEEQIQRIFYHNFFVCTTVLKKCLLLIRIVYNSAPPGFYTIRKGKCGAKEGYCAKNGENI